MRAEHGSRKRKPLSCFVREQDKIIRGNLVKEEYTPADKTQRLQVFFEKHYLPRAKREKDSRILLTDKFFIL